MVKESEILASISSDHSPVLINVCPSIPFKKGTNYWKFNSLLLQDTTFCNSLAQEIENIKNEHINLNPQSKWEIIKYKIRAFTIQYSKRLAQEKRVRILNLEN